MVEGTAPLVTVVVRTKDRPALLVQAVASLRAQSTADFETLVVNDGGVRPHAEDLEPHPGSGLLVLDTTPPHGRSRALNAGVAAARGRFVAFLDDDDLFLPEHLATLSRFLCEEHGYRAAYTDAERVLFTLDDDGVYKETRRFPAESRDFDADRLLYKNHVPLLCLMAERSALISAGPYDESLELYEDWEHLIRLSKVTRLHHVKRTTTVYRTRDDGTNATTAAPWLGPRSQEARRRVYEKHWSARSPETELALLDGYDHELRTLEERSAAIERLGEARAEELETVRRRIAALESELAAFRGDAARQLQAAGEREAAVTCERDLLADTLAAVHRSLAWRLFTPWWKLKALLSK
ncbi:MAG TPA: glycosyltransferase [Thermoanaerobaculia bacterium]|nr:glycosyltransferase [Thermoanaerobaculia bacterium]